MSDDINIQEAHTPRVTVEEVPDDDASLMARVREMTATPTPLGEFLQDPDLLNAYAKASSSERSRPSRSRSGLSRERHDRHSDRDQDRSERESSGKSKPRHRSDTNSMISIILAEGERQAHHLKTMLRITSERLESETRKADTSETRATLAEIRERESKSRAQVAEQGMHNAQLDAARAREETKRFQLQLDTAERELRRVSQELARLERQKTEADQGAAEARDLARKWQAALRDHQAWSDGREEGRMIAMHRRYDDGRQDGRDEGYEEGREDGYEEGRVDGFREGRQLGLDEGRQLGRREERRNVAQGLYGHPPSGYFDDQGNVARSAPTAVPIPTSPSRDESNDRIRQWAATTEPQSFSPPKSRPVWLRRRMATEPIRAG
ncbi:hypothetical protein OF83DRAFT_1242236 [Amylostereum chailletii]|nr:hypothetical protein OF83DRAFT_1242236 [Amylostereum chailletii]